ncbi:MAG: hypothetical protein ABW080_12475 [Candidatus Thiodiazotropha sp.]
MAALTAGADVTLFLIRSDSIQPLLFMFVTPHREQVRNSLFIGLDEN